MREISFFNYAALFIRQKTEIKACLDDVMSRGAFILQKDLAEFEERLKTFLDVKYTYGVADGTNALMLALRAAGIGPGDEVILPSHTYIATAAAIHYVGAKPVLAECGRDHLLDSADVVTRISHKTKALLVVHLNGRTCDMDVFQEIADHHRLIIIEDAAQALGSKFNDRHAGAFGTAGAFSFYPAKMLGCFGDGGAVVTCDDDVGRKLFLLRDHGRDEKGHVVAWGTNSRLDNIQAAILSLKFKTFEQEISRRREIAAAYDAALNDLDDLILPPPPDADKQHFDVYQNYELEAGRRDELRIFLKERGISTIIQWGGQALHQIKNLGFKEQRLPRTEKIFERCFMLPMHTTLSDDDVSYIVNMIRKFYHT
jgi:dTDP-4-amino-4,6-dideoxygalactose transaminase